MAKPAASTRPRATLTATELGAILEAHIKNADWLKRGTKKKENPAVIKAEILEHSGFWCRVLNVAGCSTFRKSVVKTALAALRKKNKQNGESLTPRPTNGTR